MSTYPRNPSPRRLREFEYVAAAPKGLRLAKPSQRQIDDRGLPEFTAATRQHVKTLDPAARSALRAWTQSGKNKAGRDVPVSYYSINGHLRGSLPAKNDAHRAQIEERIGHMDRALHDARLPNDVILHRGIAARELADGEKAHSAGHEIKLENGKRYEVPIDPKLMRRGALIRDRGYVPTSPFQDTAAAFAHQKPGSAAYGHVIHQNHPGYHVYIHARKGQHGLYMQPVSTADDEHEVLLPRNSNFRVHSVVHPQRGHLGRWKTGEIHLSMEE